MLGFSRDDEDDDDDRHDRTIDEAPGAPDRSKRIGPARWGPNGQNALEATENGPEEPVEPDSSPTRTTQYLALVERDGRAVIRDEETGAWLSDSVFIHVEGNR